MQARHFIGLLAVLGIVVSLLGQTGSVEASATAWTGEYFNNPTLTGSPVLTREDPVITFNWEIGGPDPSIPADNFSVRWTRTDNFATGLYRFAALTDDGVRVYVDGTLVIDEWYDRYLSWAVADRQMTAGVHTIVVEYYEHIGHAQAQVGYYPIEEEESESVSSQWEARYYNNTDLSGTPVLTRNEAYIDYNWGTGSPESGKVNTDHFSVRWTRDVDFRFSGTYRFSAWVDDGVRVYVNGTRIIDHWSSGSGIYTATTSLTAGDHEVEVRYYEDEGNARIRVAWELVSTTGPWTAEFFDNTTLSGTAVATRMDDRIDFDWGNDPPVVHVGHDNWSARWRGTFSFASGTTRFQLTSDDGARLIVDGVTQIDRLSQSGPGTHSVDLNLSSGNHTIEVQLVERTGEAELKLVWGTPSTLPPPTTSTPVPTVMSTPATPAPVPSPGPPVQPPDTGEGIVLDSANPKYFTWDGFPWPIFLRGGYDGTYLYVKNRTHHLGFWGRWNYFVPRAGNYDIYVYIPGDSMATALARYRVYHNNTLTDVIEVNQAAHPNEWVYLGRFYFTRGGTQYIYLNNRTYEGDYTRRVLYDAVRFVYVP